MSFTEKIWHVWLKRPYILEKPIDIGDGTPVILLHGIGCKASVWQNLVTLLKKYNYRVIGYDLLGFGVSPKPDIAYDIDDHARAVIASLSKLRLGQPVVLVGHSMGCLIAVRVARLRPDLVRHLVLYEMPVYEGLPASWRYRKRVELYYKFYNRVINYAPTFDTETAKLLERFGTRVVGFDVTAETWQPFVRSLKNTIMRPSAVTDIKQLKMAADVIYGTLDMFVIRGKTKQIFGTDSSSITAHSIRSRHRISKKGSAFIVQRVAAAIEP